MARIRTSLLTSSWPNLLPIYVAILPLTERCSGPSLELSAVTLKTLHVGGRVGLVAAETASSVSARAMTTALVETSEEDSFLAVGRHIGDLLNEGQVSRQAWRLNLTGSYSSDDLYLFLVVL